MNKQLMIAVDFDGTVVKHDYPEVGEDIGAQRVLKRILDKGHGLLLNTMRSKEGLKDAVKWFRNNEIPLDGVNCHPTQRTWTSSPKCYAQLYIDDAALGIPLIYPKNGDRPYVDWKRVEKLLIKQGIL